MTPTVASPLNVKYSQSCLGVNNSRKLSRQGYARNRSAEFRIRLKQQFPLISNNTALSFKSWCSEPTCRRRAHYVLNGSEFSGSNFSVSPKYFCGEHRRAGAVADPSPSQRCRYAGGPDGAARCLRWPSYGDSERRLPLFCREHALAEHINVKARVCKAPSGCGVQASFGDPLDGRVRCPKSTNPSSQG